jgi:hypothetical protein
MAGMTPFWWMVAAVAMLGVGLILFALLDRGGLLAE